MMFYHSFTDEEITHYVGLTAAYIKAQRDLYEPKAKPLSEVEYQVFLPFFPEALLKTTLFYRKTDGPVEAPDFLGELNERGVPFTLERLKAITFNDVVVAYGDLEDRIRFHELVHAVQYQKLGIKQFANKYLRGFFLKGSYEKIPLEVNARQMDETFSKNPSQAFSVVQEVQRWLNENKF